MMKHRFEFHAQDLDPTERIKWCRANLGERGVRWNFSGALKNVTIMIRSDEDAEAYNRAWRFWNVLKGNYKTETHRIS